MRHSVITHLVDYSIGSPICTHWATKGNGVTGFIAMFTLLRWCVAGSTLPPRNACVLQWALVKRSDSLGLMASQEECSVHLRELGWDVGFCGDPL